METIIELFSNIETTLHSMAETIMVIIMEIIIMAMTTLSRTL